MKLSIDPSVNNVGVCLYDPTTEEYHWGLIQLPKTDSLTKKLILLERTLKNEVWLRTNEDNPLSKITHIVCEYPQFFNSIKGGIAATAGWTLDLACICGYMAGICKFAKAYFYTPCQWKGQQTKRAIEFKFNKAFPSEPLPSEHEQEATMLMKYHNER